MHSVDASGKICINLNDFNELFDSIRFRQKIDYLVETLSCPKDISNFPVSIFFKNGQRYYISNLNDCVAIGGRKNYFLNDMRAGYSNNPLG